MISVSPDIDNPTHHVKLSDGTNDIGLIIVDSQGNVNQRAIVKAPVVRTALKTTTGNTQYSDYEPPWTPVDQNDWSGGRGQYAFETDVTRFYDSNRMNTMFAKKMFLGPQETYTTGLRKQDSALPGSVTWANLYGNTKYVARKFMAAESYDAKYVELIIKKIGEPEDDITVELCTNSGDEPDTVLKTLTASDDDVQDILSTQYCFEIEAAQALASSTYYWVKVYSDGNEMNHWEVAVEDETGSSKTSTDDSTWTSAVIDLYFRVSEEETGYKTLFFKYLYAQYCIRQTVAGVAPKLFINGDRGAADANTGVLGTLVDASKSWTTDEWAGCVVAITGGTGYAEAVPWRTIESNDSTTLSVTPDWEITHDTTTEYVIIGSNKWTEITGHGLTQLVTDILTTNKLCYFAQGDATNVRRMRWYNNSGTATQEYADDGTNKAVHLTIVRDSTNGDRIWRSNNKDASNYVSVSVAAVPASWGVDMSFAAAIAFNDGIYGRINNLAPYYDDEMQLWIFREGMIHKLNPTSTKPDKINLTEIESMMGSNNYTAVCQHNSYMYFNLGYGIERYYNQQLDDVGANADEGLPDARRGTPSYLLPYPGRLIVSIDGGDDNYSSILMSTGSGWHEIYRAPMPGLRINNMTFVPVFGDLPDRIFFNLGDDVLWLHAPSGGVDPLQDSNYRFVHEGSLETSWIHAGLYDLYKYYHSMKVFADNLDKDNVVINGYYKVDLEEEWTPIEGIYDISPMTEFEIGDKFGVTGKRLKYLVVFSTNDNSITPVCKSIVLDTITRVPVKYSYAFAYRTMDNERDLLGNVDSMTAKEKQDMIEYWAESLTALTMNSNYERFNDIQCFIDPPSMSPDAEKLENYIGKLTVVEA